jgi:hypothetical protein
MQAEPPPDSDLRGIAPQNQTQSGRTARDFVFFHNNHGRYPTFGQAQACRVETSNGIFFNYLKRARSARAGRTNQNRVRARSPRHCFGNGGSVKTDDVNWLRTDVSVPPVENLERYT